ncbi:glycosyltransferase family 4 protein [Candidatus Gracilibacteria bacterium]|nr:glycosyltransferase family 4 protein [Candidatus Gracilibacteria bacterium]
MQIVINGTFWNQPNVGSGQYLHGLLRWLPQLAPEHRVLLLRPASAEAALQLPPGVASIALHSPFDGRNPNLAKLWFEQRSVPRAARRLAGYSQPTILFVPYFAPPLHATVPVVTTVGDIIPLRMPEYAGNVRVKAYLRLVQRAVRGSKQILTFSAFSKRDIVDLLRLPAEKITPVLLAADERYKPPADRNAALAEVARRYGLHEPFVYYVGGLDRRKNVEVLLRAFALLSAQGNRAQFVIAGRALSANRAVFSDLDALIVQLGLADRVRRIDVPFEDGPLLYQACTVFAFPSRYEGFGLPPLEAMACGAPAVVSDATSLPEVVGAAALRVAPDDIVGWAAALNRLLGDPGLRQDLARLGLAQAAQFSWRRVAIETLAVIERAAQLTRQKQH